MVDARDEDEESPVYFLCNPSSGDQSEWNLLVGDVARWRAALCQLLRPRRDDVLDTFNLADSDAGDARLDAAGQMQRFRPRYWKLVFFKQQGDKIWHSGVVTEENDAFVTVALPQYQILLRGRRTLFGDKIVPGTEIEVRIGKVNPLTNDMTVLDAREPETFLDDPA